MIDYIVLLIVGLAVGFGAGLMIKGKTPRARSRMPKQRRPGS